MNEALPAAASTSGRFFLATLAYMPHRPRTPDYQTSDRSAILIVRDRLSPFIPRLDRRLIVPAVVTGLCDGVGYSAQSLALCDTPAAKVSFLGALTVVVVPCLSAALDGKRLGIASAPQVYSN
jgi:drug/metabolite transporter (DMT)-like permease